MSRRNGTRSRFDLQRKARMHNRTRIRQLRKELGLSAAGIPQKAETKKK